MYRMIFCLICSFTFLVEAAESNGGQGDSLSSSQCHAFINNEQLKVMFDFVLPVSGSQERDSSLYTFSVPENIKEWYVIDTTLSGEYFPGVLQLSLHSLKYKKYLNDKPMLLLGNGTNYVELEDEAKILSHEFNHSVKILMGGKLAWERSDNSRSLSKIKPEQFMKESELGSWGYIYTSEELLSLIKQAKYIHPFDRYLIMSPDLVNKPNVPEELRYSLFILDGGVDALENYAINQGRIISRIQKRNLEDQCKYNEPS